MNAQAKPSTAHALLDLVKTTEPTGFLLFKVEGQPVRSLTLADGMILGNAKDAAGHGETLSALFECECEVRFASHDVARVGTAPVNFEGALMDAARIADERSAA